MSHVQNESPLTFFKRNHWRVPFDFWNAPHGVSANEAPTPGTRSPGAIVTGSNIKPWGHALYISTGAATNGVYEISENSLIFPSTGSPTFLDFPCFFELTLNRMLTSGVAAGECLQGIQIGNFGTLTPFQTNFAGSFSGAVIQYRWNETRDKWETCIWDGNVGLAPILQDLAIQPTFTVDTVLATIAIGWIPPVAGANSQIQFFHNGVLIDAIIDNARVNAIRANNGDLGVGLFVTNGSTVGNAITEAGFYTPRVYQPYPY